MDNTTRFAYIKQPVYVKQEPYINDEGLWIPCEDYVLEGCESMYRMVFPKELFVEAYNKWIKGEENE